MAKYGRGLNREIVAAVNRGEIPERFTIREVKAFASNNGWMIPDTYTTVTLANAASMSHSPTYKKYFEALGGGEYRLLPEFKGSRWQ